MDNISVLEKIQIRLLQTNIFYASLLSQMRKIEIPDEKVLPTEAVAIKNGRIEFYYNPKFLETMTIDEAKGVLEHELLHVILGHLTRMKDEYKENAQIANISQDFCCVPPNTMLLGSNKFIEDYSVGDTILQSNGFGVVKETMSRDFKGDLISINVSNCLPLNLTPEHPVLVMKKRYSESHHPIVLKDPQWLQAGQVSINDYLLIPKIKGFIEDEVLDLTEFANKEKTLRNNIKKPLKNLSLKLDKDLAWVLGFYVADGSNNSKNAIGLNFSLHDKEIFYAERLQNFFQNLGYSSPITQKSKTKNPLLSHWKNGIKVNVSSSILGKAFQKWCGHTSSNKKIPSFILNHKNISILKSFLDGYFAGDGCTSTDKRNLIEREIAGTVSYSLALQCQLAILRLGEENFCRITKTINNGFGKKPIYRIEWYKAKPQYRKLNGKIVKVKLYRWKEFGEYYAVPVLKIEKKPYSGKVYNLTTENNTYVVNNLITHNCNQLIEKLPKNAASIDQYPKEWGLKPNDTAENYYDILNKHADKMSMSTDADGNITITVKDPKGNVIKQIKVKVVDSHDKWGENTEGDTPELAKEVLKQAIKEAYDQTVKQKGNLPQNIENIVQEWLKPPVISWRTLLKRFVAASIKSGHKMSWKRQNRRFGSEQKGKMSDRNIQITVAIDTSGSISDDDYKAFMSEIKAIQSCYKGTITMIECDCQIQKVYKLTKFSKIDTKFKGHGGTSFMPVFEHVKNDHLKTDVLVYFTDGFGDQEQCKKPNYPVIWVSTESATKMPFGYVISLKDNPDKKK